MRRSTTILLAMTLVLVACSPSDSEGDTTTTGAEGETTTTEAQSEETTTTGAVETTTTQSEATGGSSCVEGEWLLSSEVFISLMEQVAEGQAELGDAEFTPSEGTYRVTMASDGTFTGEREDWGFSVVTSDGTFNIRLNGTEMGTWSADESMITVSVASSDVSVDATAEIDGQTITLPQSPIAVPEAIAESSSYTCSSDTLAVTTDDVTITLDRA